MQSLQSGPSAGRPLASPCSCLTCSLRGSSDGALNAARNLSAASTTPCGSNRRSASSRFSNRRSSAPVEPVLDLHSQSVDNTVASVECSAVCSNRSDGSRNSRSQCLLDRLQPLKRKTPGRGANVPADRSGIRNSTSTSTRPRPSSLA